MTLLKGQYTYVAHANSGAAYQTALEGLADAIVATDASWSRTTSKLYQTNFSALILMTHSTGAELAFMASTDIAPLANANEYARSDGDDDRLYVSWKPSNGLSFDETTDPKTVSTWCADAGATTFHQVQVVDMYLANRHFNYVIDDTIAAVLIEYQDTAGAPGATSSVVICSDMGAASMYSTAADSASAFMLVWDQAALAWDSLNSGEAQVTTGAGGFQRVCALTFQYGRGAAQVNEAQFAAAFNPAQPWYASRMSLSAQDYGFRGVISSGYLLYVRALAVAAKTTLESADYLHLDDGMCWPWNSGWAVT